MNKILKLAVAIIGCQLVGVLGTPFTIKAIPSWYAGLDKPFFAPPNWIFGPVWTMLYALIGFSVFLVWQQGRRKPKVHRALVLFAIQLFLNFIWTPAFFGLRSPEVGLLIIVPLWLMILLTIRSFYFISKLAAVCLLPYWLWVSFALALNAAIAILN